MKSNGWALGLTDDFGILTIASAEAASWFRGTEGRRPKRSGGKPRCVDYRRSVAERAVRPLVVVPVPPVRRARLRLARVGADRRVERLVAGHSVDVLATALLPRRVGLGVKRGKLRRREELRRPRRYEIRFAAAPEMGRQVLQPRCAFGPSPRPRWNAAARFALSRSRAD